MEKLNKNKEIIEETTPDTNEVVFIIGGQEEEEAEEKANEIVALNVENSFGSVASEDYTEIAIDLLVDKIAAALKTAANQQFKGTTFLEPNEVEDVKKILEAEHCDNTKKAELEKELTKFQNGIISNYKQKLNELDEKKIAVENQLATLTSQKNSLVMKRLSKMLWPFNAETAKYEAKIEVLKTQLAKFQQKIEAIESMRPAAGEKDLLLFNVQLKEKFNI